MYTINHLTMPSQELARTHAKLRQQPSTVFPACSLKRGDIYSSKIIVWRQQSTRDEEISVWKMLLLVPATENMNSHVACYHHW
jgi:hypothetical protein